MLAKKAFNDPIIRWSTAVLLVPVPALKKYRGTFVHGTAPSASYSDKSEFKIFCLMIKSVREIMAEQSMIFAQQKKCLDFSCTAKNI